MISLATVWAVVIRHLRVLKRDRNAALSGFYWPLLDILVWGFLGSWIQQAQAGKFHNYEMVALMGILLWQVVGRGCNFLGLTLCEELWTNNVVNLFSLPMRMIEWIVGVILYYAIMMWLTAFFALGVINVVYGIPLLPAFKTFLLFMPPLFFSALWLGFINLQIVVMLGKRGTELGFVAAWFLLPFCGAYYPIDVLPQWAQIMSKFLPMSYVFEGMRSYLMHQQDPMPYVLKGYALGIPYALASILFFVFCFNRSKRQGLARLAD